ncbi:MAG TPA: hypothetical protein VK893_11860 [Pyrinomonadaceae bacterium]|nr:hypothetical protein [Pyrinomonadaceae bacterium]
MLVKSIGLAIVLLFTVAAGSLPERAPHATTFEPMTAFSGGTFEASGVVHVRGAGIRSIEYDDSRKAFFLITGAGPNAENMDFKTWEWSGNSESPALHEMDTFDRRLKPEGITRVLNSAEDFIFIVFDTSGYTATD